jgi:outer membrane protein
LFSVSNGIPGLFQGAIGVGLGLLGGVICAQPVNPARDIVRPRLALSYDLGSPLQAQPPKQPVANDASRAPTGLLPLATSAIAHQPTLRAAAARVRVDRERVEQARGAMRLNLSGTLTYQQEFERAGTTIPSRNQAAGVQGTFPLYRPQASANVDVARFQLESTAALSVETENDLLAAIVSGYFNAVQLATETGTLRAERERLLAQRNINERRMQGGAGTLVEVLETAARADLLAGQLRGAEGAEKVQLAELSRLSVMPVTVVRTMKDEPPLLVVPNSPQAAIDSARSASATLLRLRKALESAQANVGAQRSAHRPNVDLVANVDRSQLHTNGTSSQSPSAGLGVRMNVPLYSGGITKSRVNEAQAQVERAQAELQDAENTLQSEIIKAYADLERAQLQLAANVAALAISQSALDATVKAFNAGVRSNIDVLNAQQQTFTSRREAARSRVAIQLAQIRVLSLTGALNLDTIARLARSLGEVN